MFSGGISEGRMFESALVNSVVVYRQGHQRVFVDG